MLWTGQLLAPLTGTLLLRFNGRDLSRRREPRYQGLWHLPGPDSHRLADNSLSLGYAIRFSFPQASELLDAQLHTCNFRERALVPANRR